MIRSPSTGIFPIASMGDAELTLGDLVTSSTADSAAGQAAVRALVDAHLAFVWRTARRLGVPEAEVDDVTQKVFWLAARRLDDIPAGGERGFLLRLTLGLASNARRSVRRRREVDLDSDGPGAPAASAPGPEEAMQRRRAQALALAILDTMPDDLRAVFVLFEIEEMSMAEIATMMEIPPGTVASRLRRAREHAAEKLRQIEARRAFLGARR